MQQVAWSGWASAPATNHELQPLHFHEHSKINSRPSLLPVQLANLSLSSILRRMHSCVLIYYWNLLLTAVHKLISFCFVSSEAAPITSHCNCYQSRVSLTFRTDQLTNQVVERSCPLIALATILQLPTATVSLFRCLRSSHRCSADLLPSAPLPRRLCLQLELLSTTTHWVLSTSISLYHRRQLP